MVQAWWSELVTDGGAPPGRFAHAAVGAGETMYMVGGYAQGTHQACQQHASLTVPACCTPTTSLFWEGENVQ